MANILKKYSRAAGDRIQWKKVEAMFENTEKPRGRVLGWSASRAPIPLVLKQWARNTQHNANTDSLRDQDSH